MGRSPLSSEAKRTIAYLCPKCRQTVLAERSIFALMAEPNDVKCTCGGSAVHIELDQRTATVAIPCAFCGEGHKGTFDAHTFCDEKLIVCSCVQRGVDCCYIGEEGLVRKQAARLKETLEQLEKAQEEQGTFQNDIIMHEVLSEVRDIIKRGGVSCACGGKGCRVKVGYNAVELSCPDCGATMRIPAATADDLDAICCKMTLTIQGRKKG